MTQQKEKLNYRVNYAICIKHYSYLTGQSYVNWIMSYIFLQNKFFHAKINADGVLASLINQAV